MYLILFSSDDVISKAIKWYEAFCLRRKCLFSHVGLLFHIDILDYEFKKKICYPEDSFLVIESTLSGLLNDKVYNTCGKTVFGVQVRSFEKLLQAYQSDGNRIAVCEIDTPNLANFSNVLRKYIDRPYELFLTNLFTVHLPGIPAIKSHTLFCSELVYKILMELNILVKKKSPKKISPNNLIDHSVFKEPIFLTI